jgi:lysophospholipase L1-like esterase
MNVTINHPSATFTGTITVLETVAVGFTNGVASVDIPPQAIAVFGSMSGFSYYYGAPTPAPPYDANLDTSVNAIVGNSSSATAGALRAAFVAPSGLTMPVSGRTFFTMGDSITANNAPGPPYYTSAGNNYALWAHLLSNSAFRHVGVAATYGYTTAQIRATHLPTVLAAKPTACVVLAGTNRQANYPSPEIADLTAIYSALLAAGIVPIACTVPPQNSDGTNTTPVGKLNTWIRRYARNKGIPLVDFHAVTADTTTGQWISGYSGDGTHPNLVASKAMGGALAAQFTQLARGQVAELPNINTAGTAEFGNNLLLTAVGSTPDRPTGWFAASGGTTFTSTFATGAGYKGNLYTVTRGSTDVFITGTSFTPNDGDRLLVALRLAATVEASGGAWDLRLRRSTDNSAAMLEFTAPTADLPLSTYMAEVTVPAGLGGVAHYLEVRATGAAGASVSFAQPQVINLTKQGLV